MGAHRKSYVFCEFSINVPIYNSSAVSMMVTLYIRVQMHCGSLYGTFYSSTYATQINLNVKSVHYIFYVHDFQKTCVPTARGLMGTTDLVDATIYQSCKVFE